MKDVFAQWSLAEVIAAKIDRRIQLLAEVHVIEEELAEAGIVLSELRRVREAQRIDPLPDVPTLAVPMATGIVTAGATLPMEMSRHNEQQKTRVARLKSDRRVCSCGTDFSVHKASLRVDCDTCLRERRIAHIKGVHQRRRWTTNHLDSVAFKKAVGE